jgi:tripartite-type tricarboxylate transporter receptor subunit TctC
MPMPPMIHRRQVVAAATLAMATPSGWAQSFPSRPVKLYVGFAPGGAVDIIARAVGQQLAGGLGQPVVVENKPGAGTNIALRALIDSAPDGHTLMVTANSIAANPTLYQPAPFDMARDFTPVSLIGRVPVVLAVGAQTPYTRIAQLIEAAKAAPNTIGYGSPYKGGAPAITDVIAGHVPALAVNALEALPHVRSGKLRVLAVLSPARSAIFPDVPTIAESGFAGFEASVWYGVVGPARLPQAVVTRVHTEVQRALATPEVRDRLASAGGEVLPGPVELFTTLLASERSRYDRLIREARIQPD